MFFFLSVFVYFISRICCKCVNAGTGKGIESENAYLIQGKVLEREKLPIMEGKINLQTKIIRFQLKFEVVREFGSPGAFVIENRGKHEFFLKSANLIPANNKQELNAKIEKKQELRFYCNSWVYPLDKTGVERVFFSNKVC